jgi:hypothetical protein
VSESTPAGECFAKALMAKDWGAVGAVLHPEVDVLALTPGRLWEAPTADDLINDVLQTWFGPEDEIYEVLGVSNDAVVDRRRVVYRFRVRNGGHDYVCEQTVYYDEVNDQITKLRLLCSGLLPSGVERRTNDSPIHN